jgi:hypothetical protein
MQDLMSRALNEMGKTLQTKPTVLPVYADAREFQISNGALRYAVDAIVLQIVCESLPMPADDESLEAIVRLRTAKFQGIYAVFPRMAVKSRPWTY